MAPPPPARRRGHPRGAWHPALAAITLDFGNTLVPVDRAALGAVVAEVADHAAERWGIDRTAFMAAWAEERERQFREEVPRFREVDLAVRMRRVLARFPAAPAPGTRRAPAAGTGPDDGENDIALALEVYSRAFVHAIPPDPAVTAVLARLAARFPLAILSNWPLAASIDAYVAAAGWAKLFRAVVISERVGAIKPHPAMFRAAATALAGPEAPSLAPGSILHVGDDWAADVVGADRAGWRTAFLRARPADSPLPSSEPDGGAEPDLVLDRLVDLEAALQEVAPPP